MLVLIPCGGKKLVGTHPARNLYVGPYFKACLRWALKQGGRVLILSAKHGLLELYDRIENYDLRMGQPGCVTIQMVSNQARCKGLISEQVIALGGKEYVRVCKGVWPDCKTPLSGVGGIGKQLKWLKEN